uniref:Tubulin--tyrosine ligase-like protein 9 n=1 Tax=Coccolithus braarudii TaxID=221442 RepID=A0A7S0LEB2_9EUKA
MGAKSMAAYGYAADGGPMQQNGGAVSLHGSHMARVLVGGTQSSLQRAGHPPLTANQPWHNTSPPSLHIMATPPLASPSASSAVVSNQRFPPQNRSKLPQFSVDRALHTASLSPPRMIDTQAPNVWARDMWARHQAGAQTWAQVEHDVERDVADEGVEAHDELEMLKDLAERKQQDLQERQALEDEDAVEDDAEVEDEHEDEENDVDEDKHEPSDGKQEADDGADENKGTQITVQAVGGGGDSIYKNDQSNKVIAVTNPEARTSRLTANARSPPASMVDFRHALREGAKARAPAPRVNNALSAAGSPAIRVVPQRPVRGIKYDGAGLVAGVRPRRALKVASTSMLSPPSKAIHGCTRGNEGSEEALKSCVSAALKEQRAAAQKRASLYIDYLRIWHEEAVEEAYDMTAAAQHRMEHGASALQSKLNATFRSLPHHLPGAPCRYFRIGSRSDMRLSIKPAFKQLGLCESKVLGKRSLERGKWTISWDKLWHRPKLFLLDSIKNGSIVNSIPGMYMALGQHTSLARLQVHCFERFGFDPLSPLPEETRDCRFTMRGFTVNNPCTGSPCVSAPFQRFHDYNVASKATWNGLGHRIWILKPQGGFNQVGIHMFNYFYESDGASLGSTREWLQRHVPRGEWILQEYEMRPLLYQGRKFDVRAWGIITSLEPLRIFMLDHFAPKVSQFKYTPDAEYTKEQCIHVQLPGTDDCFRRGEVLHPYPSDTREDYFLKFLGGERSVCNTECWQEVRRSMEWRMTEMVLLARELVFHLDQQIRERGKRYKRFMVLQPDFVFDQKGNAYMVECNTNGYMIGDLHKDFFSLQLETEALLELVGANGYPRQNEYAASLNAHLDQFCSQGGSAPKKPKCPPHAKLEIAEMVHETHHASAGWYKIYPKHVESPGFMTHLRSRRQWVLLLTEMDRLNLKWIQFKRLMLKGR